MFHHKQVIDDGPVYPIYNPFRVFLSIKIHLDSLDKNSVKFRSCLEVGFDFLGQNLKLRVQGPKINLRTTFETHPKPEIEQHSNHMSCLLRV
jgi:hypothetical protein